METRQEAASGQIKVAVTLDPRNPLAVAEARERREPIVFLAALAPDITKPWGVASSWARTPMTTNESRAGPARGNWGRIGQNRFVPLVQVPHWGRRPPDPRPPQ